MSEPVPFAPPAPQSVALSPRRRIRQTSGALCLEPRSNASWLWQGFIARGAVTCLISQCKSGKTTLVSVLLSKLCTGGQLAGLKVSPASAVVISEEGPMHWKPRCEKFGYTDNVYFYCRPFDGKPSPRDWREFVGEIAASRQEDNIELAIIDPLAFFIPGRNENSAGSMVEALAPLTSLTSLGMAVLILHHPRKAESPPGHAARGSGVLGGYVDIIMEMQTLGRSPDERRRRLRAFSRFEQTARDLVIKLNPDASDYETLGTFDDASFVEHWPLLHALLSAAPRKLTRQEILDAWPPSAEPTSQVSLWRSLDKAAALNVVKVDRGKAKNIPFRYWLAAREDEWRNDPMTTLTMPEIHGLPDLGLSMDS